MEHVLDGDGVKPELFYLLAKQSLRSVDVKFGFRIPDTVVFQNFPVAWVYYDAERRDIQKHRGQKLEREYIYDKFTEGFKDHEICATFYHTKLGPHVAVSYYTPPELQSLLFGDIRVTGLLQRFIPPTGSSNVVLQAVWSPSCTLVSRRRNRLPLNSRGVSAFTRAATFEGPAHLSEEVLCAPTTRERFSAVCQSLADHFKRAEHPRYAIGRMVLYFKEATGQTAGGARDGGVNSLPWLLFSSSVKVRDAHPAKQPQNGPLSPHRWTTATLAQHLAANTVSITPPFRGVMRGRRTADETPQDHQAFVEELIRRHTRAVEGPPHVLASLRRAISLDALAEPKEDPLPSMQPRDGAVGAAGFSHAGRKDALRALGTHGEIGIGGLSALLRSLPDEPRSIDNHVSNSTVAATIGSAAHAATWGGGTARVHKALTEPLPAALSAALAAEPSTDAAAAPSPDAVVAVVAKSWDAFLERARVDAAAAMGGSRPTFSGTRVRGSLQRTDISAGYGGLNARILEDAVYQFHDLVSAGRHGVGPLGGSGAKSETMVVSPPAGEGGMALGVSVASGGLVDGQHRQPRKDSVEDEPSAPADPVPDRFYFSVPYVLGRTLLSHFAPQLAFLGVGSVDIESEADINAAREAADAAHAEAEVAAAFAAELASAPLPTVPTEAVPLGEDGRPDVAALDEQVGQLLMQHMAVVDAAARTAQAKLDAANSAQAAYEAIVSGPRAAAPFYPTAASTALLPAGATMSDPSWDDTDDDSEYGGPVDPAAAAAVTYGADGADGADGAGGADALPPRPVSRGVAPPPIGDLPHAASDAAVRDAIAARAAAPFGWCRFFFSTRARRSIFDYLVLVSGVQRLAAHYAKVESRAIASVIAARVRSSAYANLLADIRARADDAAPGCVVVTVEPRIGYPVRVPPWVAATTRTVGGVVAPMVPPPMVPYVDAVGAAAAAAGGPAYEPPSTAVLQHVYRRWAFATGGASFPPPRLVLALARVSPCDAGGLGLALHHLKGRHIRAPVRPPVDLANTLASLATAAASHGLLGVTVVAPPGAAGGPPGTPVGGSQAKDTAVSSDAPPGTVFRTPLIAAADAGARPPGVTAVATLDAADAAALAAAVAPFAHYYRDSHFGLAGPLAAPILGTPVAAPTPPPYASAPVAVTPLIGLPLGAAGSAPPEAAAGLGSDPDPLRRLRDAYASAADATMASRRRAGSPAGETAASPRLRQEPRGDAPSPPPAAPAADSAPSADPYMDSPDLPPPIGDTPGNPDEEVELHFAPIVSTATWLDVLQRSAHRRSGALAKLAAATDGADVTQWAGPGSGTAFDAAGSAQLIRDATDRSPGRASGRRQEGAGSAGAPLAAPMVGVEGDDRVGVPTPRGVTAGEDIVVDESGVAQPALVPCVLCVRTEGACARCDGTGRTGVHSASCAVCEGSGRCVRCAGTGFAPLRGTVGGAAVVHTRRYIANRAVPQRADGADGLEGVVEALLPPDGAPLPSVGDFASRAADVLRARAAAAARGAGGAQAPPHGAHATAFMGWGRPDGAGWVGNSVPSTGAHASAAAAAAAARVDGPPGAVEGDGDVLQRPHSRGGIIPVHRTAGRRLGDRFARDAAPPAAVSAPAWEPSEKERPWAAATLSLFSAQRALAADAAVKAAEAAAADATAISAAATAARGAAHAATLLGWSAQGGDFAVPAMAAASSAPAAGATPEAGPVGVLRARPTGSAGRSPGGSVRKTDDAVPPVRATVAADVAVAAPPVAAERPAERSATLQAAQEAAEARKEERRLRGAARRASREGDGK